MERCPLCRAAIVIRDHHSIVSLKQAPTITDPYTSSQSHRQSSSTLTQSHSNSAVPSTTAPPTSSMYLGLRSRSRSGSVSPGNASVLSPSPGAIICGMGSAVSAHPAGTTPSGGSVGSGRVVLSVVSSPSSAPTQAYDASSFTSNGCGDGAGENLDVFTSSVVQTSTFGRSPVDESEPDRGVGCVISTSTSQFVDSGYLYSPSSSSPGGTMVSPSFDTPSASAGLYPTLSIARLSSSPVTAPPLQSPLAGHYTDMKRSTHPRNMDRSSARQDPLVAERTTTLSCSLSSVPHVYVSPSDMPSRP